jgi:hypothetical protein
MNIIPPHIDCNYIYYNNPVKNTILDYGSFIRLGYSDSSVNLNGIYIAIKIKKTSCKKYFNKIIISFNYEDNSYVINDILNLEKHILTKIDKKSYNSVFKLREQLLTGEIRVYNRYSLDEGSYFDKDEIEIMLKISGIWLNDYSCGLTFKYITFT